VSAAVCASDSLSFCLLFLYVRCYCSVHPAVQRALLDKLLRRHNNTDSALLDPPSPELRLLAWLLTSPPPSSSTRAHSSVSTSGGGSLCVDTSEPAPDGQERELEQELAGTDGPRTPSSHPAYNQFPPLLPAELGLVALGSGEGGGAAATSWERHTRLWKGQSQAWHRLL
jgi:hypothetical protein